MQPRYTNQFLLSLLDCPAIEILVETWLVKLALNIFALNLVGLFPLNLRNLESQPEVSSQESSLVSLPRVFSTQALLLVAQPRLDSRLAPGKLLRYTLECGVAACLTLTPTSTKHEEW